MIPTLILYHPSPRVVERAIDIFANAGRAEVLDFAERLLDHEYAAVRSAIVRAMAVLAPDRQHLESLEGVPCPCVRVSAVAGLIAYDWIEPARALREFESALAHHEPDTRMAVANAAKLRYSKIYREPLRKLARDPDPVVASEAVRAMKASGDAWFTEPLVGLLEERPIRELVRRALTERGTAALAILAHALEDEDTPLAVRRHLPRTLSRFGTPEAAEILIHGLGHVKSGMVRYKILRGLQPLMASPIGQTMDKSRILDEFEGAVTRTLLLLHREAELMRGQAERPERATTGGRLLVDLLEDKRKLATNRIFLLLSLLYPGEDFRTIQSGIHSDRPVAQASGFELLENLLSRDEGRSILGIVTDGSALERLRAASSPLARRQLEYAKTVSELEEDPSEAVRAFAMYHAGELDLAPPPEIESLPTRRSRPFASLRDRALEMIEGLPESPEKRRTAPDEMAGT